MKKFDVEFVFYLEEGDDEAGVRELIQWMARKAGDSWTTTRLEAMQGLLTEYPFEVWVDGECWYNITRTSRDAFVAVVHLERAQITDQVLEDLADVEDMVPAAIWVVHNNHYQFTLETIQHYDESKVSTDVQTV